MKLCKNVNIKVLLNQIKGYFFFCLVALWSGSALQVTLLVSIFNIVFGVVGFLCMLRVMYVLPHRCFGLKELFFAFFILWIIFNSIVHPKDILSNFAIICVITVGYYITEEFTVSVIVKSFIRFSIVSAITAMIGTYLLKNTNLLNNLPAVTNVNGWQYKIGYIYNYILMASDRVCGFFWEPGLLATCMVFAVTIYNVYCIKNIGFKEIAVLGLLLGCCFTAKSSAGYVLGVLAALTVFLRNDKIYKLTGIKKILQFILFSIVVLVFLNLDFIITFLGMSKEYLFSKITSSGIENSSRYLAIEHNLRIWLQNPFIGVGLGDAATMGRSIVSDTSTSTYLMAAYGLGGILYSAAIIYGVFRQKQIGVLMKIVVTVIFLAIVNKEPHARFPFTWMLIFMLLDKEQMLG